MKYNEVGFRAFYHKFIIVPLDGQLKRQIKEFPGAKRANCILTYGYIDSEAGVTLEILSAGTRTGKNCTFYDGCDEMSSKIRIGYICEEEVDGLPDPEGELAARYADKIEMLHSYDASEDVEISRCMTFLDNCRHELYVDDVLVQIFKRGLHPEGCWVRMTGLGEHCIEGILLNEPDQDFGCHIGDRIDFYVEQSKDNSYFCIAGMSEEKQQ